MCTNCMIQNFDSTPESSQVIIIQDFYEQGPRKGPSKKPRIKVKPGHWSLNMKLKPLFWRSYYWIYSNILIFRKFDVNENLIMRINGGIQYGSANRSTRMPLKICVKLTMTTEIKWYISLTIIWHNANILIKIGLRYLCERNPPLNSVWFSFFCPTSRIHNCGSWNCSPWHTRADCYSRTVSDYGFSPDHGAQIKRLKWLSGMEPIS